MYKAGAGRILLKNKERKLLPGGVYKNRLPE
jgi:hypothetical protein